MIRLRRASVIAVLSVLASAATASAECAWVLWMAASRPSIPDEGPGPLTAYPAIQECESALAKEFVRLKREGWEAYYVQVRTVAATKVTLLSPFRMRNGEGAKTTRMRASPCRTVRPERSVVTGHSWSPTEGN